MFHHIIVAKHLIVAIYLVTCLFITDSKLKVFRQRGVTYAEFVREQRRNIHLFGTRRKQVAIISALNGFAQLRGFCDNGG